MSARPGDGIGNEQEAIESARAGNEAGWNWLVETWQAPLVAFLVRMLGNEDDALEIAQEAFIRALRHIGNFRAGSKFSTWLFGIAVNLSRDLKKSARSRLVQSLPEMADVADRAPSQNRGDENEYRELVAELRYAIDRLPEKLRPAFMLFYEENMSMNEISAILKLPVPLVKVRLFRARKYIANANPHLKEYLWN